MGYPKKNKQSSVNVLMGDVESSGSRPMGYDEVEAQNKKAEYDRKDRESRRMASDAEYKKMQEAAMLESSRNNRMASENDCCASVSSGPAKKELEIVFERLQRIDEKGQVVFNRIALATDRFAPFLSDLKNGSLRMDDSVSIGALSAFHILLATMEDRLDLLDEVSLRLDATV